MTRAQRNAERKARREAIVAAIDAGEPRAEVATRFGISETALRGLYYYDGLLARRDRGDRMSIDDRRARQASIAAALDAGEPIDLVALRFRISVSSAGEMARRHRVRTGAHIPITHAEREARAAAIASSVRSGMRICEAAVAAGVSAEYARGICRRVGIRKPPLTPLRSLPCQFAVLADLIRLHEPYQVTADRHGVTRQRVEQIAKAARTAGILLAGDDTEGYRRPPPRHFQAPTCTASGRA